MYQHAKVKKHPTLLFFIKALHIFIGNFRFLSAFVPRLAERQLLTYESSISETFFKE